MEWYWWLLIAVGINWGLPLLTWVYPLVMTFIFRDFKFAGFYGPFAKFRLLGEERVYWSDPDNGHSSGEYVITNICGEIYTLQNEAGSTAEVLAQELDFMEPWHVKWWKDWGGVGLYWFMCYRDLPAKWDDAWVARTIVHEGTHCWQWLVLGLFFYVTYMLHVLWIFVTQKWQAWRRLKELTKDLTELPVGGPNQAPLYFGEIAFEWVGNGLKTKPVLWLPYTKHPYLDCWAERMARKRAGQVVDVPPKDWPQGKDDLWAWW